MMFREVAFLLTMGIVKRGGVQYEDVVERAMIFVDKKSAGMQEFYLAQQSGNKLEMQLVARAEEYNGQEFLEFNTNQYKIVRTYDREDFIELKCELYNEGADD